MNENEVVITALVDTLGSPTTTFRNLDREITLDLVNNGRFTSCFIPLTEEQFMVLRPLLGETVELVIRPVQRGNCETIPSPKPE